MLNKFLTQKFENKLNIYMLFFDKGVGFRFNQDLLTNANN